MANDIGANDIGPRSAPLPWRRRLPRQRRTPIRAVFVTSAYRQFRDCPLWSNGNGTLITFPHLPRFGLAPTGPVLIVTVRQRAVYGTATR